MQKCMRCNRVSNDGKHWYYTDRKLENVIVLRMVCSSCLETLVDLLNLLFWRKE